MTSNCRWVLVRAGDTVEKHNERAAAKKARRRAQLLLRHHADWQKAQQTFRIELADDVVHPRTFEEIQSLECCIYSLGGMPC